MYSLAEEWHLITLSFLALNVSHNPASFDDAKEWTSVNNVYQLKNAVVVKRHGPIQTSILQKTQDSLVQSYQNQNQKY